MTDFYLDRALDLSSPLALTHKTSRSFRVTHSRSLARRPIDRPHRPSVCLFARLSVCLSAGRRLSKQASKRARARAKLKFRQRSSTSVWRSGGGGEHSRQGRASVSRAAEQPTSATLAPCFLPLSGELRRARGLRRARASPAHGRDDASAEPLLNEFCARAAPRRACSRALNNPLTS